MVSASNGPLGTLAGPMMGWYALKLKKEIQNQKMLICAERRADCDLSV